MTSPKKPSSMTLEQFLSQAGPGEPLEILQARHAEDVEWAKSFMDTPLEGSIRIKPGRPLKGEEAPTTTKAVKMPPDFWGEMEKRAQEAGLSLHAAMRQALLQWTKRHHPKAS